MRNKRVLKMTEKHREWKQGHHVDFPGIVALKDLRVNVTEAFNIRDISEDETSPMLQVPIIGPLFSKAVGEENGRETEEFVNLSEPQDMTLSELRDLAKSPKIGEVAREQYENLIDLAENHVCAR